MGKDINLRDLESNEIFCKGIDGRGYSDALKMSNKTNVLIRNCMVIGGSEDCIDINRGSFHTIENVEMRPTGKYAMTIKGGAFDILIRGCLIGRGSETDIDLGNWSDQSQERTAKITIKDCISLDGKPIRVRCLWADDPIIINSNVKLTRAHPILLWFFKLAKSWGIA